MTFTTVIQSLKITLALLGGYGNPFLFFFEKLRAVLLPLSFDNENIYPYFQTMQKGIRQFQLFGWIHRIMYRGISPGISFEERRRILIVNAAGLLGGTSSFMMLFPNLYNGHYLLAMFNVVTWLTGYSVFFIHRSSHKDVLLLIAGFIYSIAAAASALFFRNGVEYFLLIYAGVFFIVLDNMKIILLYSLFNILLFLSINFVVFEVAWFKPVSQMHRELVVLNGLFLFFFFLYYFKRQSQSYRQQIEVRNSELDRLNMEKEKLFAIIAHDVKAPISNLATILEMIDQGYLSTKDMDRVSGNLLKQVNGVRENLTTMLEWGNSQMRGMSANPQEVLLLPLIEHATDLIQPLADVKGLRIDNSGVENLSCWIDADHLELIMRNLLSNAVKFSNPGGVIVVRTKEHEGDVLLEVQDEGVGMSAENARRLKERFSFFSTYGTGNERGSGLGLNLCKEFIAQNGGWLTFETKQGEGSTFSVFIRKSPEQL